MNARALQNIENAYYFCRPHKIKRKAKKEKPLIKQFIKHLIFEYLSEDTADRCVELILALPWPEESGYLMQTLLKIPKKGRYTATDIVCWVLSEIMPEKEGFICRYVDGIIEQIQEGLEE